jgi:hypothetical protein
MPINTIKNVYVGKQTKVFRLTVAAGAVAEHCFSIVSSDRTHVNFEASSAGELSWWLYGVRTLLKRAADTAVCLRVLFFPTYVRFALALSCPHAAHSPDRATIPPPAPNPTPSARGRNRNPHPTSIRPRLPRTVPDHYRYLPHPHAPALVQVAATDPAPARARYRRPRRTTSVRAPSHPPSLSARCGRYRRRRACRTGRQACRHHRCRARCPTPSLLVSPTPTSSVPSRPPPSAPGGVATVAPSPPWPRARPR